MKVLNTFLAVAALTVAYSGTASALTIAPTVPPSDVAPSCSGGFGTGTDPSWIAIHCTAMTGLTELYKSDENGVPAGVDSGFLAGSYDSTFNADQSGGTITWVGPKYMLCTTASPCWLLIKDGNNDPFRYAFNLTNVWNGQETINLSGFWPAGGAISHWALWGTSGTDCCGDEIPEPGTLALLGIGLLGLGASRRRWFA